jgi:hypothetical protein
MMGDALLLLCVLLRSFGWCCSLVVFTEQQNDHLLSQQGAVPAVVLLL